MRHHSFCMSIAICLAFFNSLMAAEKIINHTAMPPPVHFIPVPSTTDSMMIYLPPGVLPYIGLEEIQDFDEIGIFSSDSICTACFVWDTHSTELNIFYVWGDNAGTPEKDGMLEGEMLTFRIWDASTNTEYNTLVELIYGDFVFSKNNSLMIAEMHTTDVIPVELCSFTATARNQQVWLTWTTASETNNYGFAVERYGWQDDWVDLGFVPGHGTTNTLQHYSFIDENPSDGHNTYRLRQMDADGSCTYSALLTIMINRPSIFNLLQNYPNPVNSKTKIGYTLAEQAEITLSLFDIKGNFIRIVARGSHQRGAYEETVDLSALPTGVYIYRLENQKQTAVKKLILAK